MNIYGITRADLEAYFISRGINKTKARFVFEGIYKERAASLSEITSLNPKVKAVMEQDFTFEKIKALEILKGEDVCKVLFELSDGNKIETVLMKHDYGNGLCVSTQVGCNMGCAFCESGRLKKVRDLLPHEMVLQLLCAEEVLGERVSHVVLMGIGEPFDNYDNIMAFADIITDCFGLDIGTTHVTVSTGGVVPKIRQFTQRGSRINLAISLHAPNDEIRNRLMPVNRAYPLSELMAAAREYTLSSNKKLTLEYILLDGINDSDENARELCRLVEGIKCYVNLIPYNETENLGFKRSSRQRITAFYDILKKAKVSATIRHEFGGNLKAACGQLRAENMKKG